MRPFLFNENCRSDEAQFAELRRGLENETDYELEAQNLRDVQKWFADDEVIVVPKVYPQFSTRRVITMDWIEGQTFDEFLESNPSQEQRDHYGTWITRAIVRLYLDRTLYTDAHPGNFLFMKDGQLGFVDFGNLRRFSDEEWKFHEKVFAVRESDDAEAKRQLCIESAMMTDKEYAKNSEAIDLIVEWFDFYNEPILYEGEFDYGNPEYMRRASELLDRAFKVNWIRQKSENMFSHRLNFQLPALFFRLKSRVHVPNASRSEEVEYERRKS